MKTCELQKRLVRIVHDLGAVNDELFDRGLEGEWDRIMKAEAKVGQVCIALLDVEQLKPLDSISDVYRRMPGATSDAWTFTAGDRSGATAALIKALAKSKFKVAGATRKTARKRKKQEQPKPKAVPVLVKREA